MQHFTGALVLMRADWWLPWKNEVVCTDASPYGYGVCGAVWPQGSASSVGRVSERSRFRIVAQPLSGARSRFFAFNAEKLSHEQLSDVLAGEPTPEWEWSVDESFPEIDATLLQKPLFTPLAHGAYSHKEDILVLESRALLRGLEVACSVYHHRNCRVLMLVDNMSVCLSFERRRSRNFRVLVCIRRLAALALALNVRVSVRWIPSEVNVSDEPSRYCDPHYKGPHSYDSSHLAQAVDIVGRKNHGAKTGEDAGGTEANSEASWSTASGSQDPGAPRGEPADALTEATGCAKQEAAVSTARPREEAEAQGLAPSRPAWTRRNGAGSREQQRNNHRVGGWAEGDKAETAGQDQSQAEASRFPRTGRGLH